MVDLKRQVNYVHCKHSVEGSYNVALEKKRTLPSSWLQGNVTLFPKKFDPWRVTPMSKTFVLWMSEL